MLRVTHLMSYGRKFKVEVAIYARLCYITFMIKRDFEKILKAAASDYPVVTIFGPRQAGKTTVAKLCFPGYSYANLEDPQIRLLAESDYKAFFKRFPPPVIIDEIQRVPSLTSAVQVMVDEHRDEMGRFIITGSQQPVLYESVSQSLAGRTAVLTLLPLTVKERLSVKPDCDTDELIFRGFMPEPAARSLDASGYYRNYFRTYVERDLRQIINIKNLSLFERFIALLAGRIGQPVNFSALASEVGVSSVTIAGWMSILEASFVTFRLEPWFTNIAKRVTKSAKVYFVEPGLAAYLLGIETTEQLSRDPLRGHLFENMVVADALKQRMNCGCDPKLYFYKTEKNFEIDLIVESGRKLRPIEIKSAMTYHPDFTKNIRAFTAKVSNVSDATLVYDGEGIALSDGIDICNFRDMKV